MQRIELKIILSVILFTILTFSFERYQVSQNIYEQFKESKQSKNELLVNTISPIISLNLSLGLTEATKDYLEEITLQNSDLEVVELLDMDENIIYYHADDEKNSLELNSYNHAKIYIKDSLTGENVASLELIFSENEYKTLVEKNREVFIISLIITFILLIIFIFVIKHEFKGLKLLTKNVLQYNPKENNFKSIKSDKKNEVTLIQNAIIDMVDRIEANAHELDKVNASLEAKVNERTQELKKSNRELSAAKEIAEHSVQVKANFLSNMSHEIRTPISAIIGMLHLIKETDLNDIQKNYLKKVNIASNNLLYIVNDILDYSKIEAGKLNIEKINFDMNGVIGNVNNILQYKAQEKNLKFELPYFKEDALFYGDPVRLGQILINLMNNAIKFTEIGGVSLEVQRLSDKKVKFIVKDSGIGLSSQEMEKLFLSFSQADDSTTRKYGGTGLGLSISKELVELMDGKIWIESVVGSGSEFIFIIELLKGDKKKIENNVYQDENLFIIDKKSTEKKDIDHQKRDELFGLLLEAAKTKIPKKCEPIINEIEASKLSKEDEEYFVKIKILLRKYDFKKIILLMENK